jgi:hypothetical protein
VSANNYLVDQFDQPLQPGQLYAIRATTAPATRASVYKLTAMIRDTAHFLMAPAPRVNPAPDAISATFTNMAAGQFVFVLVDDEWEEIKEFPQAVVVKKTRAVRRRLARVAKEARLLRVRQNRLIEQTTELLNGDDDTGEMVVQWIRDDFSTATIDDLVQEFEHNTFE